MCRDQTSYVQHTAGNEWTLFTVSNLDSQFCQAFKQLLGYLGFIMYSYFTQKEIWLPLELYLIEKYFKF